VRSLTQRDRPILKRILGRIESFHAKDRAVALELIDIILNDPAQKDYMSLVSEDEAGRVNGFICFGPTPLTKGTYDIYWVAVDPETAGKGVGARLLHSVEARLRKKHGRLVIIETSSEEDYRRARKFYEKNGYQLAERIADFYRVGEDRVTYIKRLPARTGQKGV